MNALEKLREGYARDLIDLETFERFVGWIFEGRSVVLPVDVAALVPAGPASTSNMARVLKEQWSDAPGGARAYRPVSREERVAYLRERLDRFDWGDGMGCVHSISLEEHEKNLRQRRLDLLGLGKSAHAKLNGLE